MYFKAKTIFPIDTVFLLTVATKATAIYFIFHRNFVITDIALIKNENIPKSFPTLARIIDIHVGNDGLVRLFKIKLGDNKSVRSFNKLSLMERLIKRTGYIVQILNPH